MHAKFMVGPRARAKQPLMAFTAENRENRKWGFDYARLYRFDFHVHVKMIRQPFPAKVLHEFSSVTPVSSRREC